MAYRVKDDCTIQSTVLGQLEERSFTAGVIEPKSEVEEALLDLLCDSGHAERTDASSPAASPVEPDQEN